MPNEQKGAARWEIQRERAARRRSSDRGAKLAHRGHCGEALLARDVWRCRTGSGRWYRGRGWWRGGRRRGQGWGQRPARWLRRCWRQGRACRWTGWSGTANSTGLWTAIRDQWILEIPDAGQTPPARGVRATAVALRVGPGAVILADRRAGAACVRARTVLPHIGEPVACGDTSSNTI
eukprot:3005278-Prymnesium_polylepis.1